MREYVDVLVFFQNCEAKGQGGVGVNLVHAHIKQRLGELETAYLYKMQALATDSEAVPWYRSALESVREFHEALPSHSAWQMFKGLVSKIWKVAIPIAGLITIAGLKDLRDRAGPVVNRAMDALGSDFIQDWASLLVIWLIYVPLGRYVVGFYEKRRALLGNDSDLQIRKMTSGKGMRPDGGNVYKLEDTLYTALGLVKRPEGQRDEGLLWMVSLLLLFVLGVAFFFDSFWYPLVAAIALGCSLLAAYALSRRTEKRKWM
jgi:hypothetical protein